MMVYCMSSGIHGLPHLLLTTTGGRMAKIQIEGLDLGAGHYAMKDAAKFKYCTKLIARGSARSSSARYAKQLSSIANTGVYTSDDIVGISAEGNRQGRVDTDFSEVDKAASAGARFITDNTSNRRRPYNIGERRVAEHLLNSGYTFKDYKELAFWWKP